MSLRQVLLLVAAVVLLGIALNWELIGGSAPADQVPAAVAPAPTPTPAPASPEGARIFALNCAMCHGVDAEWPITSRLRGRSEQDFYDLLDHLPSVNPMMPGFHGTDEERRALAQHLASLTPTEPRATPTETRAPPTP